MKRMLVSAVALCAGLAAAGSAAAQNLVVSNARIVVGDGRVIERGAIVVRDGKIASVTPGAAPAAARGVQVVDARGMTVMPGFIDAHRHIINGDVDRWFADEATVRMQEFLEAGYTTLMSGGGPVPGIVQLKQRVESGQLKGPRIITSGRADPRSFKTEAEAREGVRRIARAGVEIVKARIESGPPADEVAMLAFVVDEAKKHGLNTMVHASSGPAMIAAVKVGAQKLVHTPDTGWITLDDAKVVKDAGVEVLSTVGFGVPVFNVFNKENKPTFRDGKPWPESILEGTGRGQEAGEKPINGRTLWDAGVTYGYGTDTNYHPLAGLEHELRALNLVFSPIDMVRIMGPNTAAFIDKTDQLGTLEPGKLADMVVLAGDPLRGYWNWLDTRMTIIGGRVMVDKLSRAAASR